MSSPFLVTGASGCIGAWVLRHLVERGAGAVAFDLRDDRRRLTEILEPARQGSITFETGDITDLNAVERVIGDHGVRHVIHLAGLQVPFCKSDPMAGANVNVLGTVHVFEAAVRAGIERVAYASSAAVFGPEHARVDEAEACRPTTLYGVYKVANEGCGRIYFQDHGLTTVGLRPLTVYGVGRDQGLTSDLTKAMKAAVVGQPFVVRFGGSTDLIHARDVAAAFVAAAARAQPGAHLYNLHGDSVTVRSVIDRIHAGAETPCVEVTGDPLPIPPEMVADAIDAALPDLPRTPLDDGIRETMDAFRAMRDAGTLSTAELST